MFTQETPAVEVLCCLSCFGKSCVGLLGHQPEKNLLLLGHQQKKPHISAVGAPARKNLLLLGHQQEQNLIIFVVGPS